MKGTLYNMGKRLVGIYAKTMLDFEVAYHAPLPNGAKLIIANHPATIDPFLLTLISDKPMSIMVHETLFKVPLFGRYLGAAGHIEVVMGSGMAALSAAMRLLEIGRTVAIFPEGGLSPATGLAKAHSGAARLALATGAQVIPVGISLDPSRIWLLHTQVDGNPEVARLYSGAYRMTVGKPMVYSGDVNDWGYVDGVTRQMMDSISTVMRESESRLPESRPNERRETHDVERAVHPA
jgi:1-acyl-sn-glycerol-3-phosphate acyltransferase